jgi:hypothetical protein
MIFISGPTLIRPKQLRLAELFTVERLLASRGFSLITEGNGFDTFLPKDTWHVSEANLIFELFDDRATRAKLLEWSKGTLTSGNQLDELQQERVRNFFNLKDIIRKREAFSHTFEWYVGELLVRKFGAFSSSYGVKVQDIKRNSDGETSGDFDVISVLGTMEILYLECKTGHFTAKKISNMVERAHSLHTSVTVMFVDEMLSENSLRQQLSSINYPSLQSKPQLTRVKIKGNEESEVFQWHDAFFVSATNSQLNVESKLRAVLRLYEFKKAALHNSFGFDSCEYSRAGYEISEINL